MECPSGSRRRSSCPWRRSSVCRRSGKTPSRPKCCTSSRDCSRRSSVVPRGRGSHVRARRGRRRPRREEAIMPLVYPFGGVHFLHCRKSLAPPTIRLVADPHGGFVRQVGNRGEI